MTLVSRLLLAILALCLFPAFVQAAPTVPPAFERLVPTAFDDGLRLVELRPRCQGCPRSRVLEFASKDAATPAWKEQVSVQDGVTAMYAYPDTEYFVNVKVEQSMPGMFEKDRSLVIQHLEHTYRHLRGRLDAHLAADPEAAAKMAAHTAPGREPLVFEREQVNGIEVLSYTVNVLGLGGGTISQVQFFVPGRETIVTAYLLAQRQSKFKDIAEFLRLRTAFIQGYTAFLAP